MPDLELTRLPDDRRLYALEGVGTLRLEGLASRTGVAEADAVAWRFARRGLWQRVVEASDETGAVMGRYEPRGLRRGGMLRWGGRELALRPASNWRERYALADGELELALLDGKGWGRRPVKVTVHGEALDPGLLLFAAFVVRSLAQDAGSAAAAGSSAATSTG